jgi:hypothetical protein
MTMEEMDQNAKSCVRNLVRGSLNQQTLASMSETPLVPVGWHRNSPKNPLNKKHR